MTLRMCPACGKNYTADYSDSFCRCGVELVETEEPAGPAFPQLPPSGTCCLVLYGPDRQPLHYFPLTKDVTLIGREDAVEGIFPDIDLRQCLDEATARKVSRRHALILHARTNDTYTLRPLAGNSGTQLEADMVPAEENFPLPPGTRLILGGAVRFKFEIV